MWAPWFYLFIFYQQSLHPVSFCDENPLCVGSDSIKRWERMKMVWDNKKSNYQGLGKRYCTYIQEAFNLLRAPFQWAVVPVSTSLIYAKSNGEKQNDVSHPSNKESEVWELEEAAIRGKTKSWRCFSFYCWTVRAKHLKLWHNKWQ